MRKHGGRRRRDELLVSMVASGEDYDSCGRFGRLHLVPSVFSSLSLWVPFKALHRCGWNNTGVTVVFLIIVTRVCVGGGGCMYM